MRLKTGNYFEPQARLTRAEIARVLQLTLERANHILKIY